MSDVRDVRNGDVNRVMPGAFPSNWPRPIVANFIDVTARDLSEVIAPLPSINCSSGNMTSDRSKKFSSKRTKIAHYYTQESRLAIQMFSGADRYVTYGFLPFYVYPDYEKKCPVICVEDPYGSYAEFDLKNNCTAWAKSWRESAADLAAKFPEYASKILGNDYRISKET